MPKWTFSVITRCAASTVPPWCFATTTSGTFLGTRQGLLAVVIEKKNQIDGSKAKPGDITVQQYHRGFASSAFDITISHPLQKNLLKLRWRRRVWWQRRLMTES